MRLQNIQPVALAACPSALYCALSQDVTDGHQSDSALHMLSDCRNHISSPANEKTECHNIAGRMITKGLSKSRWGAGL
eukprot:1041471-Pelagomonas_calceolata.AAC.1